MTGDRTFSIWGSCVTRDIFGLTHRDDLVEQYASRSSLHSLGGPPLSENDIPDFVTRKSTWALRMIYNNMTRRELDLDRAGYLIVDFVDERTRVLRINGSYVAESVEFIEHKLHDHLVAELAFERGSTQDRSHWLHVCRLFKETIAPYENIKIILHECYLAQGYRNDVNAVTPFASSEDIHAFNKLLHFYYTSFAEIVRPWRVLVVPEQYRVADPKHIWALGAYHFIDEYYATALRQLTLL